MHFLQDLKLNLMNKDWQQFTFKTVGSTILTTVCAYSGTYFFTKQNPKIGAAYIGTCTLAGLIAYEIFEVIKSSVQSQPLKKIITAIQLLQFPFVFHFLQGGINKPLSAAIKYEIIGATAYFIAIPIFFGFAVRALNDPTFENIWATSGMMLAIASQLSIYSKTVT